MVKVRMPRASWEETIMLLKMMRERGFYADALIKEIEDQVYSQEY